LDGRAMLVRKAEVVPLEAIVRGYLVGTKLVRLFFI
jgi:phosphoribosylaminoimidazole-succinocarboxamide synthase